MADPVEVLWQGAVGGRLDAASIEGRWTLREAEQLQLAVLDRWRQQGELLAGWKVAATSGRGRNAFGPGIRPFGFILGSRVFSSGSRIELQRINRPGLETELCFRMARRVSGNDVTPQDVKRALASVAPAFEINEERLDGPQIDPGIRVADDLKHWGIVYGPEVSPVPRSAELGALVSTMTHDGQLLERVAASGHIDDHFESIAALVRELSTFDRGLEVGNVVITGSFTRQDVPGPGRFEGVFEGLGKVSVTLT